MRQHMLIKYQSADGNRAYTVESIGYAITFRHATKLAAEY